MKMCRLSAVWGIVIGLALPSHLAGQDGSARDRLDRAIQVTRELAAMGEASPNPQGEDAPQKHPHQSHVVKYTEARPWSLAYDPLYFRDRTGQPEAWPLQSDSAALRQLLNDKDPALRGLAAEALTTLYQPEDVPLLASLLGDAAEAPPLLGYNLSGGGSAMGFNKPVQLDRVDMLISVRVWQKQPVASYARSGLKLMTGREFADEAEFRKWWRSNADGRHCLWYWQRRIQREMNEAEHSARSRTELADYQKKLAAAKAAISKKILAELGQLPLEVEAKVRLLTTSEHAGGPPITGSEDSFWPEPPALRVKAERFLELLDRKNLWDDVTWDKKHYNRLAERMGLWADVFFETKHVPRLRAVLKRERQNLWWSGKAALIIGISRLLPAAGSDHLDDVETRDGVLRDAVLHEPDLFVRDYCAMELVRTGLPASAAFLKRMAFEPGNDNGSPTLCQAILQSLARAPLTAEKRVLLADIVLDERFAISWTRQNARMTDDMDRQRAIFAINTHAGRTLITDEQKYALVDPARSAGTLAEVRASIELLRQSP